MAPELSLRGKLAAPVDAIFTGVFIKLHNTGTRFVKFGPLVAFRACAIQHSKSTSDVGFRTPELLAPAANKWTSHVPDTLLCLPLN